MDEKIKWAEVDSYIEEKLVAQDAILDAVLAASYGAGLPEIAVSPSQGKFLHLLARSMHARRILEIGTLGGYSAIWLARALPDDGRLVTLEVNRDYAEVAQRNFANAGVADKIELRLGRAANSLHDLQYENSAPFDLIFIDADKPSNPDYFAASLNLSHSGTVIIIDNIVRKGEILDTASANAAAQGARRVMDMIASEPRVSATALQTVGSKGHDGFVMAVMV